MRTGKDGAGHELTVCSHRHLIDALGPIPVCCLFCVSSQSKHFLVLYNYRNFQEETNICNSCAAGDKHATEDSREIKQIITVVPYV